MHIVESRFSNNILDSELCIYGYDIIRSDRDRHGGGVLMFINSFYTHRAVFTGNPELELVVVTVRLQFASLTIALFDHRRGSHSAVLDDLLSTLCTHINPSLLSNFILITLMYLILCFLNCI